MLKTGLRRLALSFAIRREGNVALLAAMLMLPLAGIGGLAVDHMSASSAKTRLSSAADAAALAAVNTAKAVSIGNVSWGQGDPVAAGRAAAVRVFNANAKNVGAAGVPVPDISISLVSGEYVADVSWAASSPATFGRLFGVANVDLSGRAQARSGTPLYHEFIIVMDMSASMLIGATPADIRRVYDLTGCAFACHLEGDTLSYIRAQGGVRMRIDVMKDAVIAAIQELRKRAAIPGQYRFGVYAFANEVRTYIDITDPRAGDYDAVIAAVRAADPWRSNGGGTAFPRVISEMTPKFRTGNDGSLFRPLQRMIMISDGMQDERRFSADGNTHGVETLPVTGPFTMIGDARLSGMNPAGCNAIKATGAEVAMVHVEYIIPTSVPGVFADWLTNEFNFMATTLIPAMPTTMGGCASGPQLYADANTPSQIHAAIQSAFSNLRRTSVTN
jgi:hypothetical protein